MHGIHTSLRLWFWAAYLVATHTPGISAVQLQRQLGISRYETAWLILQKLRRAMVAPEREPLRGEVEVDETLVGGHHEGRRGGRQRDGNKTLVGVIVEARGQGSGRLRLHVLPTPARPRSLPGSGRASNAARSSIPTAGTATASWPALALTTDPAGGGATTQTPNSSCRVLTGRVPT